MLPNENHLAVAIRVAACAHQWQTDKAGQPYILHPLKVMDTVKSKESEVKQIAVLHDVVEDCSEDGYTIEYLKGLGFSERVLDALKLLTHTKEEPYELYIENILGNKDAMLVKLADLKHNLCITRLRGLSQKDFDRMIKYQKAYVTIKQKLKSLPIQFY